LGWICNGECGKSVDRIRFDSVLVRVAAVVVVVFGRRSIGLAVSAMGAAGARIYHGLEQEDKRE
jgi:hypothetical protein